MKLLVLNLAVCVVTAKVARATEVLSCDFDKELIRKYRNAVDSFNAHLSKNVYEQNNHFVYSPLSIWIVLATIAEGTTEAKQEKLLQLLGLPKDPCHRNKFYQLAVSRFTSNNDASILSTRLLAIDNHVTINPVFEENISKHSLLQVVSEPLKEDPKKALENLKQMTSADLSHLDMSGNSVLLDKVDFEGLWSTAFEDAIEERAPFYSVTAERLGSVDFMRVKRRVRMGYIPSMDTVGIELAVGKNDSYRIVFGIIPETQNVQTSPNLIDGSNIDEFLRNAEESYFINIAIPRMNLTSEINVKKLLDGLGVDNLWTESTWTRNISEPAALPSDFVQRATLSLNQAGLKPPPPIEPPSNLDVIGFDPRYSEFIANRPFVFGLFDAETYTCIMAAAFMTPTYVDLLLFITSCACQTELEKAYKDRCIDERYVVQAFREAFDDFTAKLYKAASPRGNYHLILSPHSTWLTIAAVAEGTDPRTQKELFKLLNLPDDLCSREKFYRLATTRVSSTKYVSAIHNRALVIDAGARINQNWYNLVRRNSLLQVIQAPIKRDPVTSTHIIQQVISSNVHGVNFQGNSVLCDYMNYNGLWTTAFNDAVVEKAPFYNPVGKQVGFVDLMKMRRRVKIGYVKGLNCKIIQLDIGVNGEYSMIFAVVVGKNPNVEPSILNLNNQTMTEVLASLQDSYLPIYVAIPRFVIHSEIDMKDILEDMGVESLWKNLIVTRHISTPPAQPSSYIQRATLTMNNVGVHPPPFEYPTYPFGNEDEQYWNEFVADRPFLFGLFDSQTYTCLMATLYTQPTYFF
ncbi:uncharacterized protein LOC142983001 [Anticarsia gemmatalis]|uniref:uncharacterized protein LOC142983001 n=1 Tax=Anticarsia gemmatalis TaxID=129554 RepID=UPI003F76E1DA